MRYLWLLAALILFALSLLTVIKAPTLLGWKLALLADELGYVLLAFSLLLAAGRWRAACGETHPSIERTTLVFSALATVLLAGPVLRAHAISRGLPERLRASFGPIPADLDRPSFRWSDLFRIHASPTVEVRTYVYAAPFGEALHLDFYPPQSKPGAQLAPCVVVVHGGGWNNGDRTQLAALNRWLAMKGYAIASIDYRLAPRWIWPAQREDAEAALHWLQAHADELAIDPQKFVLLGRSAGGQIALATAYGDTRAIWRGVISLYGPADMDFAYKYGEENDVLHSRSLLRALLGGTPETQPANYKDASPYLMVRSDDPPTLLMHGKLDTLVWHRQSERLDTRLQEAGVPHLFVSLPWATHAFDYTLSGPGGQLARNLIASYLEIVLGSERRSASRLNGKNPR